MSKEKQLQDEPPVLETKPNNGIAVLAMINMLVKTIKDNRLRSKLPVMENTPEQTTGVMAIIRMIIQTLKGSEILQNGEVRAKLLIDLAAKLNNLDPEYRDKIRVVANLGPNSIVVASSYDSIRAVLKARLKRIFLQGILATRIGPVLTSEGPEYDKSAVKSKRHTRAGKDHAAIAAKDIADTFYKFKRELQSEKGLPATTFTIEMIYKIMTDTVFGGYDDPEVASWKDDIVYYLKHLIDVQQAYAIGILAENYPENLSDDLAKKIPNTLQGKPSKDHQRTLMRLVAKMQGVSSVLDEMLRIEDELFPKIVKWIEAQKKLSDDQLKEMGFLGEVLMAQRNGESNDSARADIFGIYTAALDSTANAANWLLAELAQNPEILSKLADLQGDARMEYIQFILYELWRRDPITPIIFRQVPEDDENGRNIDGLVLKPGTIVLISVGAAGRNEKRFPNPELFDPDRYYRMTEDEVKQVKKDSTLVFAAGDEHRCQGEGAVYLSLTEFLKILADNINTIGIVQKKKGKKVNVRSSNSGVTSPVGDDGEALDLQVVFKEDAPVLQNT